MLEDFSAVLTLGTSPDLLPLSYGAVHRILLAVFAQAIRDARSNTVPMYRDTARYWLLNEGVELADTLKLRIRYDDLKAWIKADCPDRFFTDRDMKTEVALELQGFDY